MEQDHKESHRVGRSMHATEISVGVGILEIRTNVLDVKENVLGMVLALTWTLACDLACALIEAEV